MHDLPNQDLHILVLEDEPGDFVLLEGAVERFGEGRMTLQQASTLAEALEVVKAPDSPVSLILSDLNVCDSEGIETFRRLHEAAAAQPIIVMTGMEDEDLALEVVREGAQDCLVKGDLGSQALVRCLIHAVERHRQQLALEEASRQAIAASQAKTLFLANVSHEIRTPMNSILGMADLLLESGLREDQVSYVDTFRRCGEGLVEIVNGLLDLSRIEAGQLQLENAPLPLWELFEGVGELLAFQAHRKGLALVVDIADDVPAWIMGDACRLRQILINLVGNAVKFTCKGEVSLQARIEPAKGPILRMTVRDTGAGIPADRLERIFDDFSQADPSTARRFGGSGLGLALSRRLAEAMGGSLMASSDGHSGSEFEVAIPIAVAEAPVGFDAPATGEGLEGRRVLVADDSVDNLSLVEAYAKGSSIELSCARDGREAFELFRQESFDLVLMDVQMPVMTGHEATSAIRTWEREEGREPTPILALTAYAFPEDRERSAEVGCNGHLVKPLRKGRLFQAICDYTRAAPIEVPVDPALEDLIPDFLAHRRGDVDALRDMLPKEDLAGVARLGHNMKGTGRGYGFDEISEIGDAIEQAAKAERRDEISRLTDRLDKYLARVWVSRNEDEKPE